MKAIRISSGLLAIARVLSCLIALILVVVLLVGGSTEVDVIHAYKLEFAHINVAKGLYSALKLSSSGYSSRENLTDGRVDPFQPDVTSAEIQILIEYLTDLFQGKPEFIVAGITKYCYGSYKMRNITRQDLGKPFTHIPPSQNEVVSSCGHFSDEEFNYRQMLLAEGLNMILDYAYQGNIYGSTNNKSYQKVVNSTRVLQNMMLSILTLSAVLQLIILLLTFYNIKQRRKFGSLKRLNDQRKSSDMSMYNHTNSTSNVNSTPKIDSIDKNRISKAENDKLILIINSILSTILLVLYLVLTIYFSAVFINLRHQVSLELGDFGFKLHGGRMFMTVLWLVFLCLFLSFILWSGVLFLVVPNQVDQYALHSEFLSDSEFHNNLEIIKNREREYTFINQYSSDKGTTRAESVASIKNDETDIHAASFSVGQVTSNKASSVGFLKNKSMSRSAGNYRKSLQNLATFAGESKVSRNTSPSLAEDIKDINNVTLLNRSTSIGTNVFSMRSGSARNMTLDLTNAGYTENSTFLNTAGSQIDGEDQLIYYREPKEDAGITFINPFEDP